MRRDVNPD